jgi:hypothetical protein
MLKQRLNVHLKSSLNNTPVKEFPGENSITSECIALFCSVSFLERWEELGEFDM